MRKGTDRARIGILGGTFDPIHNGHLTVAEEVGLKLGLEEILFVPAGQPWMKSGRKVSSAEHRLEMVLRATASNPRFNVSTLELERPGPSFSVDTVEELRASLGAGAQIYFIVGFDALADLPRWKDPERLLDLCQVVAVRRPGYTDFDLGSLDVKLPGASGRVLVGDTPLIDISGREIRRRAARGLSIRGMVPEPVADYIEQHRLYGDGGQEK